MGSLGGKLLFVGIYTQPIIGGSSYIDELRRKVWSHYLKVKSRELYNYQEKCESELRIINMVLSFSQNN